MKAMRLLPRKTMPNQRNAMFGINGKLSKLSMGKTVRVIGRGRMLPIANKKRTLEDSNESIRPTMSPESVKAEETLKEEAPSKKQLAEPSKMQEESVLETEAERVVEAGAGEAKGETSILEPAALAVEEPIEPLFNPETELLSIPMPSDEGTEGISRAKGKRRGKKHRKNR